MNKHGTLVISAFPTPGPLSYLCDICDFNTDLPWYVSQSWQNNPTQYTPSFICVLCFFLQEFQKKVIYLLTDIRDMLKQVHVGMPQETRPTQLPPRANSVEELMETEKTLKSLEAKEKMVSLHSRFSIDNIELGWIWKQIMKMPACDNLQITLNIIMLNCSFVSTMV